WPVGRPSREAPVKGKGGRVSVAEEPSSEMPSTCRPWSPCATTQTSSGSMKSSGRPESHQSWPSPPSCESSSSSQTPSSETSAAGSAISLDQHGYSGIQPGAQREAEGVRSAQSTAKDLEFPSPMDSRSFACAWHDVESAVTL